MLDETKQNGKHKVNRLKTYVINFCALSAFEASLIFNLNLKKQGVMLILHTQNLFESGFAM